MVDFIERATATHDTAKMQLSSTPHYNFFSQLLWQPFWQFYIWATIITTTFLEESLQFCVKFVVSTDSATGFIFKGESKIIIHVDMEKMAINLCKQSYIRLTVDMDV